MFWHDVSVFIMMLKWQIDQKNTTGFKILLIIWNTKGNRHNSVLFVPQRDQIILSKYVFDAKSAKPLGEKTMASQARTKR